MSENNKKYILITAALIVIGAALYFLLDAYAAIYIYSDPRGCTTA